MTSSAQPRAGVTYSFGSARTTGRSKRAWAASATSSSSRSRPPSAVFRRVDAYLGEGQGKFLRDPKIQLFSLREQHYGRSPDVVLHLEREASLWFNAVMVLLLATLRPGSKAVDNPPPAD
jgi:hypothetical protein